MLEYIVNESIEIVEMVVSFMVELSVGFGLIALGTAVVAFLIGVVWHEWIWGGMLRPAVERFFEWVYVR